MCRRLAQVAPVVAVVCAGALWLMPRAAGQAAPMPSPANGDRAHYTADVNGSRYVPLDQITTNGHQNIIVAVSGGVYSGEYIAFALAQNESR
jgi:glucose dehydrogenase